MSQESLLLLQPNQILVEICLYLTDMGRNIFCRSHRSLASVCRGETFWAYITQHIFPMAPHASWYSWQATYIETYTPMRQGRNKDFLELNKKHNILNDGCSRLKISEFNPPVHVAGYNVYQVFEWKEPVYGDGWACGVVVYFLENDSKPVGSSFEEAMNALTDRHIMSLSLVHDRDRDRTGIAWLYSYEEYDDY
jgi:hypothetical protein